jgi:hypothetical protein
MSLVQRLTYFLRGDKMEKSCDNEKNQMGCLTEYLGGCYLITSVYVSYTDILLDILESSRITKIDYE